MGDYRPIIPSGWQAASKRLSPTGSNDSSSNSGNTGGRGYENPRRRRTGGSITQLACTECRRARAKCDGEKPDVCTRCQTRSLTCTYEPHTKTQKDELIQQLQTLRAREETVLRENRDYSIILDILTNNGHVDEVIKRLRTGDSPETIVKWLSEKKELAAFIRRSGPGENSLLSAVHRVENMYAQSDNQPRASEKEWTTVTNNSKLVRELLDLYLTWMHPHHMLFSEMSFLDHFVRGEDGPSSYCSSALVNAVCAMACNILLPAEVTKGGVLEISDRTELQRAFLDEARAELTPDKRQWLTSLQTFAVMFLVELGAGRARVASSYLRFAADNLPSRVQENYKPEVWEASRWGIHTLTTVWCAFTYQKPFNPQPQSAHISLKLNDNLDWGAYSIAEGDNPRRPSFAILTATFYANLFRIVHRTITLYCGASGKVTAKSFLTRHEEYLAWKDSLPNELQLDDTAGDLRPEPIGMSARATDQREGQLPLPHVVSLHLQYYTAIVELFLPLLQSQNLSVEFRTGALTHILENARKGIKILEPSARRGLCRWYMPMTIHSVLHLCDAVARHSPDMLEKRNAVQLCTNVLQENRKSFKISGPLLQMFRETMRDYNLELSKSIDEIYGSEDQYGMDDLLEACTRLTYAQPSDQITRLIDVGFEEQWSIEISSPSSSTPPTHFPRRSMRLDDVLNES